MVVIYVIMCITFKINKLVYKQKSLNIIKIDYRKYMPMFME